MSVNKIDFDPIHLATYASLMIDVQYKTASGDYLIEQTATGFVYTDHINNKKLLITNWHVVTGRNPDAPEQLQVPTLESPRKIQVWIPTKDNKLHFLPLEIELYKNNKPVWLEARSRNGRLDIVAIPVDFPDDFYVVAVQDFAEIGGKLKVGQDVTVIGFPFGRYEANPFAVWKKAMIASEPRILLSGRPRYFLDTPGRPGMSGSPVYAISEGMAISKRAHDIFNNPDLSALDKIVGLNPDKDFLGRSSAMLCFVGVYSGSYGPDTKKDPLREMGLGFSWLGPLVDLVLSERIPGENPFLPDFD